MYCEWIPLMLLYGRVNFASFCHMAGWSLACTEPLVPFCFRIFAAFSLRVPDEFLLVFWVNLVTECTVTHTIPVARRCRLRWNQTSFFLCFPISIAEVGSLNYAPFYCFIYLWLPLCAYGDCEDAPWRPYRNIPCDMPYLFAQLAQSALISATEWREVCSSQDLATCYTFVSASDSWWVWICGCSAYIRLRSIKLILEFLLLPRLSFHPSVVSFRYLVYLIVWSCSRADGCVFAWLFWFFLWLHWCVFACIDFPMLRLSLEDCWLWFLPVANRFNCWKPML